MRRWSSRSSKSTGGASKASGGASKASPGPGDASPGGSSPKLRAADGVDLNVIERANRRRVDIAYTTCGSPGDPCVLVPPGGGATKENSLFWARELATTGRLFVVLYDLRDTGASQQTDWSRALAPFGTTAVEELSRVLGADAEVGADGVRRAKREPGALNPELMELLWDYDAHARDGIAVLDELNVDKAHVLGLSQGGFLAQMIAVQFPERVLTCVSAGSAFDGKGVELAMMSRGAEDFFDQVKAAKVFDAKGKRPFAVESVGKAEYVAWKVALLEIIAPGFEREVYVEMASKEFQAGPVSDERTSICALCFELWVRTGKLERHHAQLRENVVPMLFIHGRQDPIIHFGEVQRLFQITKNCVLETHDFGHNFGPPREQSKLLAKVITSSPS